MKKIIAIVLVAMLVLGLSACGQKSKEYANDLEKIMDEKKFTVTLSPDFAPMEFVDATKDGQDQYVGFDVMLAKYIAEKLGVELVISAMDFTACQAAVSMGAADASISGYSKTDERAENYNLSDFYYTGSDTEQYVVTLKDRVDEFKTAEDFAGKTVSAQNASLQWNLLVEQLPDAKANAIVEIGTGVLELVNGKVDAMCIAGGNAEMIMQNYPELAIAYQFDFQDEGNVILLTKGEDALTAKINEILAEAYAAGLYDQWYTQAQELYAQLGEDAVELSIEAEKEGE